MMDELMTDTSPAGMIAAIAVALEAAFLVMTTAAGGEARTAEGFTVAITGLPIADFNGVYRTRLAPGLSDAEVDARIADVVAYLQARALPFGWWVMPTDVPGDLRARLAAHGFAPDGERLAMAIDLDRLGTAPLAPTGLAIEEVVDLRGLHEHTRLMATGFGLPPVLQTAFREQLEGVPYGPGAAIRYFLARAHGQAIGTSLVVLPGGATSIFNIVTVPEARGRGVGALVTDAALRAAREAGYRIAVLESSGMGYHVYRRLGFEEYCKIGHFAWSGEANA